MPATDRTASGQTVIKRSGAITGDAHSQKQLVTPKNHPLQQTVRALLKRLGFIR